MKKIFLLFLVVSIGTFAVVPEKYIVAPKVFMNIYLDNIENNDCQLIEDSRGQYLGQADNIHRLSGFGKYLSNNGEQIIGCFYKGDLLQGIKISGTAITVGNTNLYACYSPTTGHLEYIFNAGKKELTDTKHFDDETFYLINYSNGEQYMGEVKNGKREGLGIYYYKNGDMWYGTFKGDIRLGFGCLFCHDNSLIIGEWEGEDIRRSYNVNPKGEAKIEKEKNPIYNKNF